MSQLIDLCGVPIQIDKIKSFRLIKRDCLFYPVYQEMENMISSLFAGLGAKDKKKFRFVKMVPFGVLLNDRETPQNGGYAIKSFGEAAAVNVIAEVGKAVENLANLAADILRIDTSGNTEYRVLTHGHRLMRIKARDIPAKVMFLSGKVSDVYKNDPIYKYLGEPIAPTVAAVPALTVTVDKTTHVFFGGGIDLENAEETYHKLFEAYNQFHKENEEKKALAAASSKFTLNLPKLSLPGIKIQSPFVIAKKESGNSEKAADSGTLDSHMDC